CTVPSDSARQDPTPILFVVPDRFRQAAIAHWADEEARALSADPSIFFVTIQAQVNEHTILTTPIWQVVGVPEPLQLIPEHLVPKPPVNGLDSHPLLTNGVYVP
ncbi:MAG: hypothetical protein ACREMY_07485, partial [bacterium]